MYTGAFPTMALPPMVAGPTNNVGRRTAMV
jgi:hypothetical protein